MSIVFAGCDYQATLFLISRFSVAWTTKKIPRANIFKRIEKLFDILDDVTKCDFAFWWRIWSTDCRTYFPRLRVAAIPVVSGSAAKTWFVGTKKGGWPINNGDVHNAQHKSLIYYGNYHFTLHLHWCCMMLLWNSINWQFSHVKIILSHSNWIPAPHLPPPFIQTPPKPQLWSDFGW